MAAASSSLQLVNVEERPYQAEIAQACHGRNSLIVLPTGLGKTLICARVMARHLEAGERVLVLAPTRPLVEQQAATFREHLPEIGVRVVTGQTSPEDRGEAWQATPVVVATPQVARNDLLTDTLDPSAWGLLVVDEAHRAVGNYAAVPVAEGFQAASARILGATASPGAGTERFQEVCDALGITHVEARGPWDEDVRPYLQNVRTDWVRVTLPRTLQEAAGCLKRQAEAEAAQLRKRGLYASRFTSKREMLKVRSRLNKQMGGSANKAKSRAYGHVSRALRVLHAVQLVQTQSVAAARTYLTKLCEEDEHLASARPIQDAKHLLDRFRGEHPKMRRCAAELRDHLQDDPEARAIVFTKFRETARTLTQALERVDGVQVGQFVGQSGPDGMRQEEQVARLEELRSGQKNVLVATSVGEEGLDVPHVDLVLFYEPVASPVRTIQRRGRTGRHGEGRVVLLMARGTPDEAAYWSASKKERKMRRLVRSLQGDHEPMDAEIRSNPSAQAPDPDDPRVLVDHRELNGPLARLLRQRGIGLDPQNLPVGDVILSNRVAVERKDAQDLCRSILDGRLMDQARSLKRNFEAPVLLVEGDPFEARGGIRKEAIAGAISAVSARFGVTVLTVRDTQQAADLVAAMVRQERKEGTGPPKLRYGTAGRRPDEQQRYLLEGLPHISATLAQRLLEHFSTPGEIFAASEKELRRVHGIGPTTARAIHEVLHEPVEAPWRSDG